jgi:hypothetical protein
MCYSFMVCKYKYSIYLGLICSCNILHVTYEKIKMNNIRTTFYQKKCITHNINANIRIQKLLNVFINAQQMVVQLATYLVFSLPVYHSF